MRFIRTVSVKHHPTGDHYQLSIPAQVAQAIGLQDGGLVSIEVIGYKGDSSKKAVSMKAYRDSEIAWREQFFDLSHPGMINKAVVVPPRTLGPSKPWGRGKITDWRQDLREIRASLLWMNAEFRKTFPRRRGRRRCR
jgi:bifunctional DNA-binding transcriptional regulator/antitoxin component of YhaV-PrlF toxin-antitoxin module